MDLIKMRKCKVINISFVIVGIIMLICLKSIEYINVYNHTKIVNNIFKNADGLNKIEKEYIGYIEFLEKKIEIVNGINKNNLDKHHACIFDEESLYNNDTIIIAGHNITDVFNELHNIKIGDYIKIKTKDKNLVYKVKSIEIVDRKDISILNDDVDLILITCMNNFRKRLIIKANN